MNNSDPGSLRQGLDPVQRALLDSTIYGSGQVQSTYSMTTEASGAVPSVASYQYQVPTIEIEPTWSLTYNTGEQDGQTQEAPQAQTGEASDNPIQNAD